MAWSGQFDRAVLLSGDSDFVPAVEAAKDAGVIVKLAYARNAHAWAHDELLAAADEPVELDGPLLERFRR